MSSSAFFIEAAANTIRLLSWASTGEAADPHRRVKAVKIPARRCIESAPCLFAGAIRARESGVGWIKEATGGSAVPLVPATYGRSGYRSQKHNRLRTLVKGPKSSRVH